MSKHYLYIGGLTNQGKDDFLDYSVKVGISKDHEERYNFLGVKNPYSISYYDVYEIESSKSSESERLAQYFEKKILSLYNKDRYQKSEFLTFKNGIEVNGFTQRIHGLIMGILPFIHSRMNITHIGGEEEITRRQTIDHEKKRFSREFLSLLPPSDKEILGLGTFSYKKELNTQSDEAIYDRFRCCWYTSQDRAKNCKYGILFHDRKVVALFDIEKIRYHENERRISIEATRNKKYDGQILDSQYNMFVPNPVMYFNHPK